MRAFLLRPQCDSPAAQSTSSRVAPASPARARTARLSLSRPAREEALGSEHVSAGFQHGPGELLGKLALHGGDTWTGFELGGHFEQSGQLFFRAPRVIVGNLETATGSGFGG